MTVTGAICFLVISLAMILLAAEGFTNGISTEKYVNLCRVSRATAYRELAALCEMGVLVQTGMGRGTRYQLKIN